VPGPAVSGPALPSFRGPKEEGKAPGRQTAKEGEAGCLLASVGLGRDSFNPCERQLLKKRKKKRKSYTETGVSLLHLI